MAQFTQGQTATNRVFLVVEGIYIAWDKPENIFC